MADFEPGMLCLAMSWTTAAAAITGTLALLAALLVLVYSSIEREWRAFRTCLVLAIPLVGIYVALSLAEFEGRETAVALAVGLPAAALLALLVPFQSPAPLRTTGPQTRVDERDAVFHRFYRLRAGTEEFAAFYEMHPELRAHDDSVRAMPPLAGPGSRSYDPLTSPFQVAAFQTIARMGRDLDHTPRPRDGGPVQASGAEFAKRVKGYARYLGAHRVGCTKLNPAYVYSHIGRSPGQSGAPIALDHEYAIAISVEMSDEMVRHAPGSPTLTETAFRYLEAGKIAIVLARYIELLGYEARAHVDGNYRVLCVPIAHDAGLGELGRLGLLMDPDLGPRIRLAIVTTNLPVEADAPLRLGVQHFCSFCKKCADACPSRSIDAGDKQDHNGVERWQSQQDSCYRFWRTVGSDCAICVKVCPYSHPNNLLHRAVRGLIRRNPLARRVALLGDDLLYGRRPCADYARPDWH